MRRYVTGLALLALVHPPTARFRTDCEPLAPPKRLPGLDVVLDSASLSSHLQTQDTTLAGELIVSVRLSNPPSGHLVEGPAPVSSGELAVSQVLGALRPASKDSPLAFRVHIQLGRTPGIRLERSQLCAPELIGDAGSVVGRVVSRDRPATMQSEPRQVTPKILIGANGKVLQVSLGSGTGYREIDTSMREAILAQHYYPAMLDGRPVDVWLTGKRAELVP